MQKPLLTIILLVLGLFTFTGSLEAAILEKTINRVYELNEEYVKVTETSTSKIIDSQYLIPAGSDEVFTIFNPIIKDGDAKDKIELAIPSIKVTNENGKKLKFRTEIDGQHVLIKVPRPTNIVSGKAQVIKVSYNSYSLSSRNGALVDLYIPSFAKSFKFTDGTTVRKYNTVVRMPKSFGENNFVIPKVPLKDKGDYWQVNFSQKQLTGTISWIQMGTEQHYRFSIRQPYESTTSVPLFFNTYDITLPRNVSAGPVTQDIIFTKFDPEPRSVLMDRDGNLIASFRIPATESGEIIVEGFNTIKQNKEIRLENSGKLSDIPPELVENYTQPALFWESSSPEILEAATALKGDSQDVYQIISDTYSYVVDKIDYSNVKRFGINERQGALKTLQGGAAVCMEYSDLFIALTRAQGIPARAAFGYGYDSRSTGGSQTAHQWAEVYIPELGEWVGVDTTWGEAGPAIIGGDMNHFYKYVSSVDPQTPAPVSLTYFGEVPNIEDEDFDILAISNMPEGIKFTTQEDLLQDFPTESGLLSSIGYMIESVGQAIESVDAGLNLWIIDNFEVTEITSAIIRWVLYFSPLMLMIGLGTYVRLRNKKLPLVGKLQ